MLDPEVVVEAAAAAATATTMQPLPLQWLNEKLEIVDTNKTRHANNNICSRAAWHADHAARQRTCW